MLIAGIIKIAGTTLTSLRDIAMILALKAVIKIDKNTIYIGPKSNPNALAL